ncbi:MAG: NAD(+)/NADH kinase [Oscillospiraceae bacterium]|nr:NAD(+)/NADH kinase [Oscillospiraceae bacterium]
MKIVIVPNPYRDKDFRYARQVQQILCAQGAQLQIALPFGDDTQFSLPKDLAAVPLREALQDANAIVCLGGDGTLLHIAKEASEKDVPILGVNIGSLGFMAELESRELSQLEHLTAGDYSVEERMMLDVSVTADGRTVFSDRALNDVVITKGTVARIIQADVYCDGSRIYSLCGDGVIVCTPTGSTGYSLSAGGPILDPTVRNILITPICAHRPQTASMVLGADRVLTVQAERSGRRSAFLSVDGGKAFRLTQNCTIKISASESVTKLIRLKNTPFFSTISHKLYST